MLIASANTSAVKETEAKSALANFTRDSNE